MWDVTFLNYLTVVFNVSAGSSNCHARSTCVPIFASVVTKIYILSLTAYYFHFFYPYFTLCYESMLSLQYNLVYNTDYVFLVNG
jgi:hypothetical protein